MAISKDGKTFSLSSLDELEESEFGVMEWVIAEEVEQRLHQKDDK